MKAQRATVSTLLMMFLVSLFSLTAFADPSGEGAQKSKGGAGKGVAQKADDPGVALVEAIYSKLANYNKAVNRFRERERKVNPAPGYDLRFDIMNISSGAIEDIYEQPFGSLVSKPSGRVIQIRQHVRNVGPDPEYVGYEARWVTQEFTPSVREDWERTSLREVLALAGTQQATHYVAYEVAVHLNGMERRYKALALVEDLYKSIETPKATFFDNIVSQTALNSALNEYRPYVRADWTKYIGSAEYKAYRRAFNDSGRDYMKANATLRASGNGKEQQQVQQNSTSPRSPVSPYAPIDPCYDCDPGDGDPPATDEHTYGTPVSRERVGDEKHFCGVHKAKSTLGGHCTYTYRTAGNELTCRVEITDSSINDSGPYIGACHQVAQKLHYHDGQGPMSAAKDCDSTYGAAVKECIFCACSISITVSGVGSVDSDGFWEFEHGLSYTCAAR